MREHKPIASLSLDLDNQWSYMKTHGDAGWQSFPSYLDVVVPRVLNFLKERNDLAITFFIVGQDAALDKNREALAQLSVAAGGRHEIGNHSFNHEPWLHLYTRAEIRDEIIKAEEAIERVTSRRTRGFRGPGYSLSPDVLSVLAERDYKYDASTFPTFLGPLARAYYFMTARLEREQRQERKALFGKLSDGLRPLKTYRWQVNERSLTEIPVTTMPVFKMPVHVSYLLYLSGRRAATERIARHYFNFAMRLCELTGTAPSLLLHPLDFLGFEDMKGSGELSFFPGMNIPRDRKLETVGHILESYTRRFNVRTLAQHAQQAAQDSKLPARAHTSLGDASQTAPKVEHRAGEASNASHR
ncbi:MAG TPA: polysaccharide deacetylase family protein [Pyrinomonadaceae bacterium]|nr:polysaccharide deacetylase family protein [Pyrinomonadaceae bacterium]